MVDGWDDYPGGNGLNRFDGTPVVTAPQLQDYFADDAIQAVAKTAPDFRRLDVHPDLTLFPGLLTILGGLVVIYGIIMLLVVNLPDPEFKVKALKTQGAARRSESIEPEAEVRARKTQAALRRSARTDFNS